MLQFDVLLKHSLDIFLYQYILICHLFLALWSISLYEHSIIYLTNLLWWDTYYVFMTCLYLFCYYKDAPQMPFRLPVLNRCGSLFDSCYVEYFSQSKDNSSTNTHGNFLHLKEILLLKSFGNYWVRNSF